MKKRDNKRIINSVLIVIMLFSMFLLSVQIISAETVGERLLSGFKIGSIDLSNLNLPSTLNFTKFLLFALVTLIIYSISGSLPFVGEKRWLAFSISLIIGFLSIFYLLPKQVYTILMSYKALGIALTSIIPFIVIAVVAKRLHDEGHAWISKVLWIGFGVVLGVIWFTSNYEDIGQFGMWAYGLTAILTLLMILFEKWIYFRIFKSVLKGEISEANERYAAHLTAKMEKILDQMDSASPTTRRKLEVEYDELQKKLDKATTK